MRERSLLVSAIIENAERDPGKTAIVDFDGKRKTTYGELVALARRIAGYIRSKGISEGSFISVKMANCMEFMAAELGIWLSGCAAVPMGAAFPPARVDYIVKNCESRLLIDMNLMEEIAFAEPFEGMIPEASKDALIIYTSGSTGNPKGILISFEGLDAGYPHAAGLAIPDRDTEFGAAAPFYFIAVLTAYNVLRAGGTVHIYSESVKSDVRLLEDYICRFGITVSYISPAVLRLFHNRSRSLKAVVAAGEALTDQISKEGYTLYNMYGLTEAVGAVCAYEVPDKVSDKVPLGRCMGNAQFRIADDAGRDVPQGTEGELLLGGRAFCREYFRDPENTAKLFENGWLHTKDIVHLGEDGLLYYHNRKDWMVKINGQRVDTLEVEHRLSAVEGVNQAVVKAFTDGGAKHYLVGYYISEKQFDPNFLKEKLGETMPAYMIPAFFVKTDSFPLNVNGKIDRKLLPRPDMVALRKEYVAPENETQKHICDVMAEILGVEKIGITDDFFDLGGDSLSCMEFIDELQGKFGLTLSTHAVYAGRSPEKIAASLSDGENAPPGEQEMEREKKKDHDLLPYQLYYLDYQMYSPHDLIENNPMFIKLPIGIVKPEKLRAAVDKVLHTYAAYATVFTFNSSCQLVQRYRPDLIKPVEIVYTTEKEFEEKQKRLFVKPFRVLGNLLYHCRIFVTEESLYLGLDCHHTIGDGTSFLNTIKAVFDVLQGREIGPDAYYAYLGRHEKKLLEPQAEEDLEKLRQLYDDSAYSRYPKPDFDSRDNVAFEAYLTAGHRYDEYVEAAKKKGTTLGTVFTAAGLMALRKYNGTDKVSVEWIFNGRDAEWKEKLVGLMMSAIPAAVDFGGISTVEEILSSVKDQVVTGVKYADYSFAVRENSPALSDYMKMIYELGMSMPENAPEGTEKRISFELLTGLSCIFQCIMYPAPEGQPLGVLFNCNGARYKKESVERFADMLFESMDELVFG